MVHDPVILILAAGSSSRMGGRDKLLEDVDGEPLLRRQVRIAGQTGCPVLATLPPDRPARGAAIADLPMTHLIVPDAAAGMSASLRHGVQAARRLWLDASGLMILPADMPDFTGAALLTVINAFRANPTKIVRATTADGRGGHPAIFPADLWADLARASGDTGGRHVLTGHADRILTIPLPGQMATTDLDTPEDWDAWRKARSGRA